MTSLVYISFFLWPNNCFRCKTIRRKSTFDQTDYILHSFIINAGELYSGSEKMTGGELSREGEGVVSDITNFHVSVPVKYVILLRYYVELTAYVAYTCIWWFNHFYFNFFVITLTSFNFNTCQICLKDKKYHTNLLYWGNNETLFPFIKKMSTIVNTKGQKKRKI